MLGTIWRALAFCLLFAILDIAATGLIADPLAWLVARAGERLEVAELTMLVAAIGATAIMVRSIDVRSWRDIGLARDAARPRPVGAGWCVGFAAIGLACALLFAIGWLHVVQGTPGSSLAAAARVTFVLIPAAFSEELLCRGYLLTVVRERIGWYGAIGLTSVAFGLLHAANPGATVESVLIVTLAGIFLAAIRVAYDSLYAAWSAHVAWNWAMAVPLHAPVSGVRFESPDYRTVSTGPAWITGGTWGPEGGLAAALGMIAALAYLYTYTRRRREES